MRGEASAMSLPDYLQKSRQPQKQLSGGLVYSSFSKAQRSSSLRPRASNRVHEVHDAALVRFCARSPASLMALHSYTPRLSSQVKGPDLNPPPLCSGASASTSSTAVHTWSAYPPVSGVQWQPCEPASQSAKCSKRLLCSAAHLRLGPLAHSVADSAGSMLASRQFQVAIGGNRTYLVSMLQFSSA